MCGRFANSESIPVIAGRWAAGFAEGAADWQPSDDFRPSQRIPVLLEDAARPRRLGLMTWGWTRDFARSSLLINARAEDAEQKPTFSAALRLRRCLVPATTWFEWQEVAGSPK